MSPNLCCLFHWVFVWSLFQNVFPTISAKFFSTIFIQQHLSHHTVSANIIFTILYEPRHEKTCLREFPTRSDSNWPAQLQKLAWVLKFRLYNLEILYYLSSENKGADQTARMRRLICAFVVRTWHKIHFLMARLIYFWTNKFKMRTIHNFHTLDSSDDVIFWLYM